MAPARVCSGGSGEGSEWHVVKWTGGVGGMAWCNGGVVKAALAQAEEAQRPMATDDGGEGEWVRRRMRGGEDK